MSSLGLVIGDWCHVVDSFDVVSLLKVEGSFRKIREVVNVVRAKSMLNDHRDAASDPDSKVQADANKQSVRFGLECW